MHSDARAALVRPDLTRLKKRADFLLAARARRSVTPGFILQARDRREATTSGGGSIRIGFTCSKKVGNAVARNRAKRRLRAVADAILPALAHPGWDYVLIGRHGVTASRPFARLQSDLAQALADIHKARS